MFALIHDKAIKVDVLSTERNIGDLRIKESIFIVKLNPEIHHRHELGSIFLVQYVHLHNISGINK